MAIWGAVAKMGAGMLKGRAKKQTGAAVASKVTGVYSVKANPNATSSELDAKKIVNVGTSTQNISKSTGGNKPASLKESALRIKVTTIEVNTLLKGSLALDKMRAKNKKKTQEQLKRTKAEDGLESDNKGKFKLPIPGAKKVKSLWERIKNFFITIFWGMIAVKLLPLLPLIGKVLPLVAKAADWFINFAVGFVDVLASAIKIGYDAYDKTKEWVEGTFGEGAAEKFDSFMSGLNQVMNAVIAVGLAAAAFGGGLPGLPGRKKPEIDPTTGRRIKGNQIVDVNTGKVRPKTKTEKLLQTKHKISDDGIKTYNKARAGGANVQQALEQAKKVKPKPKKVGFWGKVGQRVSGAASAVGKGVVSGATATASFVGKGVKGALNMLPNFNKLGDELAGVLANSYETISSNARKQYDNVVGLATKLKGKWDDALGAAGGAFNKLKKGAQQKIMDTILTPVMKVLEPLKKRIVPIADKIVGVLKNIPGYEMITKVLKKFGGAGSKEMLEKLGQKSLPIIGGIINLAFAYDRFANGDTIGGLIEGTSGILDLVGMAPASMALDLYMFGRDFVPQIQQGEDKAIAGLGLTGLQNDMDKMFAALPDLGTITKMITGGDKEKKEAEESIASGTAGTLAGGSKEEIPGQKADVKDDAKESAATSISKGSVKDQENKLKTANQQGGAQAVIDSISSRASYEGEGGADIQEAYDQGYNDGSSGVEKSEATTKSGKALVVASSGSDSDPYEGLYKGS